MRIRISRDDPVALSFVTGVLGARRLHQSVRTGVYMLDHGGDMETVIYSLPETVMGHKRFSMRVGKNEFPLPDWVRRAGDKVIVAINADRVQRLAYERNHLLGMLGKLTRSWLAPENLRGFGGAVVYESLVSTGRVITRSDQVPKTSNRVLTDLTGLRSPVVAYGTTDLCNVFELLQTLKAAWFLGLPAVFDTYDHARCVGDYWSEVLIPSLQIWGGQLTPGSLGLDPAGKFTQSVDESKVFISCIQAGLSNAAKYASELTTVNKSLAQWYRAGLWALSQYIMSLLDINVPVVLVSTTDLIEQGAPFRNLTTIEYARQLEQMAGHPVVAFNQSGAKAIRTDELYRIPVGQISEIHEQGYWLGGSGIYWAQYGLGLHGGIVHTVKDSRAGLVHLMALPYLQKPSDLHVLPIGLFRLSAESQPDDWSIDLWVFWELLLRWGETKSREVLRRIWEAMEVPLARENIGRKTIVKVGTSGISITN